MNISGFIFNNLRFRRFNIAAHDNLLYHGRYISLCAGSYVIKARWAAPEVRNHRGLRAANSRRELCEVTTELNQRGRVHSNPKYERLFLRFQVWFLCSVYLKVALYSGNNVR